MTVAATRIAIVSASVAAGHDGFARELACRLRAAGHQVECHDFVHLIPGGWGRRLRAAYRRQLEVVPRSWGWLLGWLQHSRVLSNAIGRLSASSRSRLLTALDPQATVVISTYPLATQTLARMKRQGLLQARLLAYLTDPSVHRLAIASGVDLYLAVHEITAQQAHDLGAVGVAITTPAVPTKFRPAGSPAEQQLAKRAFSLPDNGSLALVLSGSWGVGDVFETTRDVVAAGVVPVVVCGQNEPLRARISREIPEAVALGWVDDMPLLMRACDVVVQNAGGLGLLEARASGLPVLSYRCLPGHGETNAEAWARAGIARWVTSPDDLREALASVRRPHRQLCGADPVQVIEAFAAVQELAEAAA
ncbi:glycosyltransferase [Actinocrispum sp. NPDC049592]|uniref:glycosyltransferase n=1 Tax=Actinocrispum sp. NPDC049592 TaxID=3154835 RepID=UPI00343F15D8